MESLSNYLLQYITWYSTSDRVIDMELRYKSFCEGKIHDRASTI